MSVEDNDIFISSLMNIKFKEQYLFELFKFSVTFEQLN